MQILITGGAGFLGSNMVKYLLEMGHTVTAVDNLVTGVAENVALHLQNHNFEFVKMDMCDENFVKTFSDTSKYKFDRIYDFACPTGVPNIAPEKLGELMLDTCTIGVRNMLLVARAHKATVFHASSAEVYGEPLVTPQSESYTGNVDSLGFRAPYEEGKRVAESYIRLYAQKYGINAKIIRFFNAYGPNYSIVDLRIIGKFITQALRGEPLTMHGDGSQNRTFCYVDDSIRGLELVMEKGVSGEAYNIGGVTTTTVREFADLVLELTGSKSPIQSTERPSHDHSGRTPDLSKITALGWKQEVSLKDGLALTIADFKRRLGQK